MYSKTTTIKSINGYWGNTGTKCSIERTKEKIERADAVVIGAGAGLSTSADLLIPENALKIISLTL